MQIGFIGLGAVVETAYLPALRRLGDVIDRIVIFAIFLRGRFGLLVYSLYFMIIIFGRYAKTFLWPPCR